MCLAFFSFLVSILFRPFLGAASCFTFDHNSAVGRPPDPHHSANALHEPQVPDIYGGAWLHRANNIRYENKTVSYI